MDTTTLRGEKTLQELTERLYGCLHGEQKQRAETLLLKANPGLEAIGRLPRGALLTVPTFPGITNTPDVQKDDPQDRMRGQIRADLEAYRQELGGAVAEAQKVIDRQLELVDQVGGDILQGLIGDNSNLEQVVGTLRANLDLRRGNLKKRGDNLAVDPMG